MGLDVTATLGVPGSASTWAFNVVREIQLLAKPGAEVESFYSDCVERVWPVLRDNQHWERRVIWKLHEPDELWSQFLAENGVALILSVRDPRDAMLSLMERFGETMEGALERVRRGFCRVSESLPYRHIGLRYEDRFFEQVGTVAALAAHLGIAVTAAEAARIFDTYRTESVRRFAGAIGTLPPARVRTVGDAQYDETTQIHRAHIGDQLSGKWRERFDPRQQVYLTEQFRPFLEVFGYETV